MANSQSDSKIFSLRIVSIDYYMAPPLPNIDTCYSSFQGGKVNEVPVIRIYGSTPAGQKTCLHVHRAFPYLYVPCSDIPLRSNQEADSYTNTISLALEKALKLKGNAGSKRQHVHGCSLVRARKFYGYHSSEELFVKICLYYPHDVSRAANLLLGGAVLDKSLQPHESHIPFILQFLIDYNLYGMGHVHVLKMKFRHPVPDACIQRRFNCNSQHGQEMCMSDDFQAGLTSGESLDTPIWITSTIPDGWMWQFSSEYEPLSDQCTEHINRQSICELEGDAAVDEILNQQCKTYTSLSQTSADVKMVHSLVPIWEEEYERTGVREAVILPVHGKPLAEDALRTLSRDLEFERKLAEYCCKSEENIPSLVNDVIHDKSLTSSIEEELAEIGNINHDDKKEPLKSATERDIIGSSASMDTLFVADMDAPPSDKKDACLELLSVSDVQSSEIIGTWNSETADAEALGVLRWLATSQAAEDINSDDELACEAVLSPLLPTTTIDKILERANIDYESESQKECQDILDTVEDLTDFESSKEQASHSIDNSNQNKTPSKIPQGDSLLSTTSTASGNPLQTEISDTKRHIEQQVLQINKTCRTNTKKRISLWGSLPFSTPEKCYADKESSRIKIADAHDGKGKSCLDISITRDEEPKNSDAQAKNSDVDVYEVGNLVGCSVRDLMRKKRCRRIMELDCGNVVVKKVHSVGENEQDNILLPKNLDIHAIHNNEHDERPLESMNFSPSITIKQIRTPEAHGFEFDHPHSHIYMKEPHVSRSDSPLQVCTHPTSVYMREKELDCSYKSNKQDSAITNCETDNYKAVGCYDLTCKKALNSNTYNPKFDPLSYNVLCKDGNLAGKELGQKEATGSYSLPTSLIEDQMFTRDDYEYRGCQKGTNKQLYEIPKAIDVASNTICLQSENCVGTKQEGDSDFSLIGSSVPKDYSMEGGPGTLISMTFSKKPPIMNWNDGPSEEVSFLPALSFQTCFAHKDRKHGSSGSTLDELLPYFGEDFHENKVVQHISLPESDPTVQREAIVGVPTYYQNDGSLLYLLTPVYSPPSVDSVYRWLACDHVGAPQEINMLPAENLSIQGSHGDKIPTELSSLSNSISTPDQAPKEISQNVDSEFYHRYDNVQRQMHSEQHNGESKAPIDGSVDLSQISGPNGRSRPTPLSQIGFRDPASVGAGQQLTLLSIEVQTESRGDLRPDPRFDAINVVALAFQNDNDSSVEIHTLLHGNTEFNRRNSDGISVNKVHYFSEEKHLFSHFIKIMSSYDPDVIMGWDIQGGSLGFLAERAAQIGMGLLNKISRTPFGANIWPRESEISDGGVLDGLLHESSVADAVLVENAVIEDEWGRTHASGVHVGGRIVLNVWRLMRGEVKLNMYTLEAVAEAVLRLKIPSIPQKVLTKWFASGPGRARYRCIEYIIQRAKLNLEITSQLDMINRTSELARVFGIDFFSVLSRGSQYRVESMLLRLAHSQNYLAVSPGNQQVASQPAMECLPLVMEPESGFYSDPVVVLDFQSLYPSMIIAYNLCFSTCLGNVARWKENILGVCSFSPEWHVLRDLKDKFLLTPNGVVYVSPKVRHGILPRLLEEILSTRIMVKKAMKKLTSSQQVLHRIFNARQLALKLIANVTYGYTAAGFSGRMPCAEIADSIVQCGRCTLEKAIALVNANDKWNAKVIYGDTDSMFVLLKGRSVRESFRIGEEIASAVTAMNPNPVTLKMEKVYHPCFLLTKKRYVGYSYESAEQSEPIFDAKGIETVRRDTCAAVAKMMEQSLKLFFESQDISEIKEYLQRQWTRILSGRVSIQDFVFAKEVRLGTYSTRNSSSLPPAAIVATKAMRADPRAEPRYAERVPYVVIHGEPGARLVDMVVDPLELLAIDSPYRLNDIYYINKQIIPALQRVFGLLRVDLSQWFLEMPRPGRDAFAKRPSYALNPQRTRIDFYYLSKHCVLCGELVHASTHICKNCSEKEADAATAIIGRTSKLEKEMQHLAAICRHCGGGDWIIESGVKCTSLACSVFYERRKVQKELQGLSYVAADKGYYPKCMIEWF
ncbi:DNA polymerase zeta catalytic subunit isoform X2 [Euphorbia lathyris]|uniref:DNA polymerase zeta catalytic subunit isoform X2 n=1 Tax=Euphorbia lathyris TaxID=212925 RepID=UPI003313B1A1